MGTPFTMTQDFRQEFEVQTLKLLRQRFRWYVGAVGLIYALGVLMLLGGLIAVYFGVGEDLAEKLVLGLRGGLWGLAMFVVLVAMDMAVFALAARAAGDKRSGRDKLLRRTQQFLMYRGSVELVMALIAGSEGFPWTVMIYHILGCALLPWTPGQALRPMLLLLPLNAATLFMLPGTGVGEWRWSLVLAVVSCFAAAPGLFVAWAKTSQRSAALRMRFLQDRYGQMRRELVDARRIHEALFPRPFTDATLRFSYKYEPMRQIGGDYLYARFCPTSVDESRPPAFDILLIDVTGHGIAAALTVNRVYGEVERLFAEDPFASPADVLSALNRYVHLTLARHSIFATALCIRADPASDRLEYASGGHPPAFLCRADGRIVDLESTAYVLGAVGPGDFDAGMKSVEFMPGDALIAYTDGAIEARNAEGRMFGVFGFQRALAACMQKGSRERGGSADGVGAGVYQRASFRVGGG